MLLYKIDLVQYSGCVLFFSRGKLLVLKIFDFHNHVRCHRAMVYNLGMPGYELYRPEIRNIILPLSR